MTIAQNFKRNAAAELKTRNISQASIVRNTPLSKKHVSRLVSLNTLDKIDLTHACIFAAYLDVPLDSLTGRIRPISKRIEDLKALHKLQKQFLRTLELHDTQENELLNSWEGKT